MIQIYYITGTMESQWCIFVPSAGHMHGIMMNWLWVQTYIPRNILVQYDHSDAVGTDLICH